MYDEVLDKRGESFYRSTPDKVVEFLEANPELHHLRVRDNNHVILSVPMYLAAMGGAFGSTPHEQRRAKIALLVREAMMEGLKIKNSNEPTFIAMTTADKIMRIIK